MFRCFPSRRFKVIQTALQVRLGTLRSDIVFELCYEVFQDFVGYVSVSDVVVDLSCFRVDSGVVQHLHDCFLSSLLYVVDWCHNINQTKRK